MNKNVYYPTYTIDPESIYGSGIVKANKFPTTNTTTSVITDSFPVNKKLSPPVYRSGLALKPLDTNAYRILKDPFGEKYKLDNYYYASQQNNNDIIPNVEPTLKEKLVQKIKNVANKIVDDKVEKKNIKKVSFRNLKKMPKYKKNNDSDFYDKKQNNIKNNSNNKKNKILNKNNNVNGIDNDNDDNDDNVNDNDENVNDNDENVNDNDENVNDNDENDNNDNNEYVSKNSNIRKKKIKEKIDTKTVADFIDNEIASNKQSPTDKFGRNKKMWINDHYLYALEPRYASVVYPWRAYTWMYPVAPNTDNYYVDNINSSPADPLIISNDTTNKGNYQATYLRTNMLKENFNELNDTNNNTEQNQQKICDKNFNILYFIIIVLILSIYFYKE